MSWEPDYVTVEQFKTFARINDALDDAHIARAITAASRQIDKYVSERPNGMGFRRQFGAVLVPEPRYYTARWDQCQGRFVVEVDDFMNTVGLIVKFDVDNDDIYETTCTDFIPRPKDAVSRLMPYTQIAIKNSSSAQPDTRTDGVEVTALFGWTTVPVAVEQAALLQAHRIFKRRQSPLGVSGSNNTGNASSETKVESDLDPDAVRIMGTRYIRIGRTE